MCPFNCFSRRGPMGPYSQKNLDKNCGAPFGLDKMLVLVIKQPNWTLSDKNKEVCSI